MLILAAFAAAVAAAPEPGDLKTFRDWTVGCDNGRACHATSLIPEEMAWEYGVSMSIKRGPEANAKVEVAIFGVEGKVASLAADGKALPARLTDNGYEDVVDPADVPALLDIARTGRVIDVRDAQGHVIGNVSLSGASAAMLYMDDVQKRVGTQTALVRKGAQPASSMPPPPPLPVVRSAVAPASAIAIDDARIARLRKQTGCGSEDVGGSDVVEIEPLDPAHTLVLLSCGGGAYNFSSLAYIAARRGGAVDLSLARFDREPGWGATDGGLSLLVNAGWDRETRLLNSFAKGRGIGDCGVGSDYAWDGERFRLVKQIEMGECRGSMDYITTWRAEVVER